MNRDPKIAGIARNIEEAFPAQDPPHGANLVRVDIDIIPEREEILEAFEGKRRQDISGQFLEEWSHGLFYMEREGFLYYLPVYLLYALSTDEPTLADEVLGVMLLPSDVEKKEHYFTENMEWLSEQQRCAIKDWINHMFRRKPYFYDWNNVAPFAREFWEGLNCQRRSGQ